MGAKTSEPIRCGRVTMPRGQPIFQWVFRVARDSPHLFELKWPNPHRNSTTEITLAATYYEKTILSKAWQFVREKHSAVETEEGWGVGDYFFMITPVPIQSRSRCPTLMRESCPYSHPHTLQSRLCPMWHLLFLGIESDWQGGGFHGSSTCQSPRFQSPGHCSHPGVRMHLKLETVENVCNKRRRTSSRYVDVNVSGRYDSSFMFCNPTVIRNDTPLIYWYIAVSLFKAAIQ